MLVLSQVLVHCRPVIVVGVVVVVVLAIKELSMDKAKAVTVPLV